jgi:predicted ATP-dependent serine protease
MTQQDIKALSNEDISLVIVWALEEVQMRNQKRKQDAITQIKEAVAQIKDLAAQAGVTVSIAGTRGRPPRIKTAPKTAKTE